jgi:hypothetical protein
MGADNILGMDSILPYKFDSLRISEGYRPIGFRFSKHIINLQAQLNGQEILACGEANNKELAAAKAISELLERAALYSPKAESLGILTSNGFASHPNEQQAEINAMFEVVERDGVLSNWYSKTPFIQITPESLPSNLREWIDTELSRSEYPILKLLISTEGFGPSVSCILMNRSGHGVTGHASGINLLDSIESSIAEACRSAHHALRMTYWNESLRLMDMNSKVEPSAHAVFYAYHRQLPPWLFGKTLSFDSCIDDWNISADKVLSFRSSFVFDKFLEQPVHTILASHPECIQIKWGTGFNESLNKLAGTRRLPTQLKDGFINLEPHFVA